MLNHYATTISFVAETTDNFSVHKVILRRWRHRNAQLCAKWARKIACGPGVRGPRPPAWRRGALWYQFSDNCCPAHRKYVGFSTQLFTPIGLLTMPTSLERKYIDQYPKLENITNYKVVVTSTSPKVNSLKIEYIVCRKVLALRFLEIQEMYFVS